MKRFANEVRQTARKAKCAHCAVINLPPNKDGRLVGGDIENLMKLSEKLGIRRETADKN